MRDLEGVERGWCPICVERYSFSSASNRAASRSLHWSELAKSCLEFQPQSPIRRRLQELRKPSGRSPGSRTTAPTTTSIADPNIICPAAPGDPAPAVDSVVDNSSVLVPEEAAEVVAQDGREAEEYDVDDLCRHCGCPASSHARLSLQQSEKDVLTFVRPVFKQRQFSVSNGISVSVTEAFRMAREKNEERNEEFVYGEILENTFLPLLNELWTWSDFYSEDEILHREKQIKPPCRRGGVFYDLGCGFGKAAVLAALSDWNFESCVGVELLPDLLSVGQKMVKELLEKTQEVASDESTSCSSSSTSSSTSTSASAASNITTGTSTATSTTAAAAAAAVRFSEYTKDTLAEQHAVWREQLKQVGFEKRDLNTYQVPPDARLIYVAATMFKEDLRQNIRRNLANVDPKNTLLVTIQHQLPDTVLVREVKLACSWGITKAFVCKLPG
mmetsp:Transcript_23907/g.60378  ORF Transcript_23907/g.60378 Transcript_23907/m.60378 type:complete len:444 (-) Transcript_23907:88-1419(-)